MTHYACPSCCRVSAAPGYCFAHTVPAKFMALAELKAMRERRVKIWRGITAAIEALEKLEKEELQT